MYRKSKVSLDSSAGAGILAVDPLELISSDSFAFGSSLCLILFRSQCSAAAPIEVQEDASVLETFQGMAKNRPVFEKIVERLRLTKQSRAAVMCENCSHQCVCV